MKIGKFIKVFQSIGNYEGWVIPSGYMIKIFQKAGNYEDWEDYQNPRIDYKIVPKGW